jgi:hypothetical protein
LGTPGPFDGKRLGKPFEKLRHNRPFDSLLKKPKLDLTAESPFFKKIIE